MKISASKFSIGQKVSHQMFGYRGVVLDVDSNFELSEKWYAKNGWSSPPKDAPWYHVLVHDTAQMAYVAEMNLIEDYSEAAVSHPVVDLCFEHDAKGRYQRRISMQ